MATTVTYDGKTIASVESGENATVNCKGMLMKSNIEITNEGGEGGEGVSVGDLLLSLSMDTSNYVMTAMLKDKSGNVITSSTVDLPLESMVVNGKEENGNIVLTLQNGNTVSFSISHLVNGLVSSEMHSQDIEDIHSRIDSIENGGGSGADLTEINKNIAEISKTLENLKGYVTPQMYGAKGDGSNSSAAIQQAIDESDFVFIPVGKYRLDTAVNVPNNKKIQIEGEIRVNCDTGFIIQGSNIQICGNGTLAIESSIPESSAIRVVVDKSIGFVNVCDISMWGAWNYDNTNNHVGVEFVGSSTVGTCCYVNINCNLNCFTKAIWSHAIEDQHIYSWLTQVDVNSIIQNCLQAIAYEWGGGASRIRGVIQPKCTSKVTPNSVDLPLCILPESIYMDAMVWDMDSAMNKYAVRVTGRNVTILSEIGDMYMDIVAAVKPTLMLRIPTENLATKEDLEAYKPSVNANFRIDDNGCLMMEENSPYTNILGGNDYKDNYRLSSGGEETSQSGTVLTGYIPFKDVSDTDIIRTKGVSYPADLYCGIRFYDKDFISVGGLRLIENESPTLYGANNTGLGNFINVSGSSLAIDEKGVATIKVNFEENVIVNRPIAYLRLFAKGVGSDLIITRNEEIVEYVAEEQNIGKVRPEYGVDYFTEEERDDFVGEIIASQSTKTLVVTYSDGTSETVKLVVAE
jgi:hypothetical protein